MNQEYQLPPLPWTGGCQCGAVRYVLTAEPLTLYACHCTECQQQSASAFGMSMRIRADAFNLEGKTASFIRDPGKPTEAEGVFCATCGSRLVHKRPGAAEFLTLKGGSLDIARQLRPVGNIWTRSRQAWTTIDPELLNYDTQPEDRYAALIREWQKVRS